MCDNFCLFLNLHFFKRDSYIARWLSSPHFTGGNSLWRIGREGKSLGCGYPPSIARSQEAGGGILGIYTEEESSPEGLLFWDDKYFSGEGN